jgi:hypothetical protein
MSSTLSKLAFAAVAGFAASFALPALAQDINIAAL